MEIVDKGSKSKDEEKEASCCIPQAKAIKIIGTISCSFGVIISTLTSILTLAIGKNGEDVAEFIISCTPVNWLLIVGMMQTVNSVLLLVAKEKRKLMKIWTISHILTAITTVVYLWSLLSTSYVWDYWTKVFFSFVGFNFCIMIFMTLVMIEFLLRPATEDWTRERDNFYL